MIAHLVQSYGTFQAGTCIHSADAPITVPIARWLIVTVLSIPLFAFFTVLTVILATASDRAGMLRTATTSP
jgi:hypothetical protein